MVCCCGQTAVSSSNSGVTIWSGDLSDPCAAQDKSCIDACGSTSLGVSDCGLKCQDAWVECKKNPPQTQPPANEQDVQPTAESELEEEAEIGKSGPCGQQFVQCVDGCKQLPGDAQGQCSLRCLKDSAQCDLRNGSESGPHSP